jgi:hypothetical protein
VEIGGVDASQWLSLLAVQQLLQRYALPLAPVFNLSCERIC